MTTDQQLPAQSERARGEAEMFPFTGTDAELIEACRERPWRYAQRVCDRLEAALQSSPDAREGDWPADALFNFNEAVTTRRKPFWVGQVCGWYRNGDGRLGYNVEAEAIPGAIHVYPEAALTAAGEG